MRPLVRAALDRLIRHEPGIATTATITAAGMSPARDVALVRVSDADREPIQWRVAVLRQMKNKFVAIGDKATRVDRFEMTNGDFIAGPRLDGDGFDPVKGVLQNELVAQGDDDFMRQHRIDRSGTD